MGQKKYKLLSAKDGEPKICAFFQSEQGCKNGSNCKFLHVKPGEAIPKKTTVQPITNSDISSESSSDDEDSIPQPTPIPQPTTPQPKAIKKKKTPKNDTMFFQQTDFQRKPSTKPKQADMNTITDSVFVNPQELKIVYPQQPVQREDYQPKADNRKERRKQKRKGCEETQQVQQESGKKKKKNDVSSPVVPTDSPFLNTGIFASMASPPPRPLEQKPKKKKKVDTAPLGTFASMAAPTTVQQTVDFRSMNLPITSFSALPEATTHVSSSATTSSEEGEITEEEEVLIRHEEYSKWKLAIDQTKKHPKYTTQYRNSIEQMKENMSAATWVIPKLYNPNEHSNLPQVIAIDCEMCRTKCPSTGQIDSRALCRISIINGNDPKNDVLLDTLVKPAWPIIDDVSFVHGITKDHLKDVKFKMEHVQAFLSSLCTTETIIIGHGLINDLVSMRLDYSCMNNIIDTAFLYNVVNPNPTEDQGPCSALPSLQDLANAVLTKDMPKIHDSVNDAQTAFFCADFYRTQNGNVPNITKIPSQKRKPKNDSNTLFLHRLPQNCTVEHLMQLFQIQTHVVPQNIQPINFNPVSGVGKTYVLFSSVEHANLAFESFDGECLKDATGRSQKRIYLKGGGYVCVRKMIVEEGGGSSSDEE